MKKQIWVFGLLATLMIGALACPAKNSPTGGGNPTATPTVPVPTATNTATAIPTVAVNWTFSAAASVVSCTPYGGTNCWFNNTYGDTPGGATGVTATIGYNATGGCGGGSAMEVAVDYNSADTTAEQLNIQYAAANGSATIINLAGETVTMIAQMNSPVSQMLKLGLQNPNYAGYFGFNTSDTGGFVTVAGNACVTLTLSIPATATYSVTGGVTTVSVSPVSITSLGFFVAAPAAANNQPCSIDVMSFTVHQ